MLQEDKCLGLSTRVNFDTHFSISGLTGRNQNLIIHMYKMIYLSSLLTIQFIYFSNKLYCQPLFKHIPYGESSVSFYSEIQIDKNRFWNKDEGIHRNVQLQIWYPVEKQKKESRMKYRDYLKYLGKQDNYREVVDPEAFGEKIHLFPARHFEADSTNLLELLETRMLAHESNSLPKKIAKLILFSQGATGTPINNTPLFELLASYGYVVVSFPTRQINHTIKFTDDLSSSLKCQTADIRFILDFLKRNYSEQLQELHYIGISSGALASYEVLATMDFKASTFVSLDGSISYAIMKQFISNYKLPLLDIPTLLVYRNVDGLNNSFHANASSSEFETLIYNNLRHADFTSGTLINRRVSNFNGPTHPDASDSYEHLAAKILSFLSNEQIQFKINLNENYIVK